MIGGQQMRQIFKVTLAVLAISIPAMAGAWPLWIIPSEWRPTIPGTITVQVFTSGIQGTPIDPLPLTRIASLRIIDAKGSRALGKALKAGPSPHITIPLRTPGSTIIAVETKPLTESANGADFNAFLTREGFAEAAAAREKMGAQAKPAIVTIVYYLKSIVQTGDKASANYFAPIGQSLELIPLDDPYLPGTRLPRLRARALDHGQPAPTTIVVGQPLFAENLLGPKRTIGLQKATGEDDWVLFSGNGGSLFVVKQLDSAGDGIHYTLRYASLAIRLASR
jgi:hypothetical protein